MISISMSGKVALVTGAGGDLGGRVADVLAAAGARVVLNDLQADRAEASCRRIHQAGGTCVADSADITDSAAVGEMIGRVKAAYGGLDVLVNNAGGIRDALLDKMTDEDWDFVCNLNLKAAFLCSRAALPLLRSSAAGRIVNVASMAYRGNVGQANYASAKAGLVGLTRSTGLELARERITVNCVAPGLIATPKAVELSERVRDRLVRTTPMRRMGSADDIAHAVLFFASDKSAFVTRQVLHVSGGMEGF